ncbi:MAG: hypothetical protein HYU76_11490 [Betaproteobacteria bacterium]|nr:hypothetical protein [Betaproteobacteria bacterium]
MSEAVDISSSSGTGGESIEVNHVVQASAGATGTKTATVAGHDGGEGVAQIFALRPGANLTISVPAGTIADDVMIAAIAVRPSSVTITTPAGWTLVGRTDQGSGNTNSQAVYQRVAGAAEPASYTWTLGGAPTGAAGGIMSFSGVATVSPIATAAGAATASALTHTAPSISPIFKNTMLITSHSFSSAANWTPPSGMTEAVDVASIAVPAAGGISLEMNYEPRPADGSTGTRTATASNDADTGVARSLALQPSLTIPLPAGTVANDVMVASIAVRPSTVTITPPAGWTLVRRMDQGAGTTNSLAIYSKVAGASEPAFYTWVTSATTGAAGGIQSFSGVDTATPIDVENGASTASSLSHATPSITTTVANAMLVASFDFSSSATWTPPAGMTEGVDVASRVVPNSAGISLEASFAVQAAAGATGGKTATASNDADTGNAHILALRPSRTGAIACASAGGSNSTLDLPGVNLSGRNGVVVFVGYNNNNFETVTSVVIDPGGASQTSMGAALASAATVDDAQIYIFGLVNPPQGIFTIRVTFSAALLASHGSNICAYPLIGVNTSNPFGTPGTNANPSGNGSVVVPSAAGELVLAGLAGETIGTSTVAAPAVEDADIQGGSGTTIHHLATARQDGAAPNVTISWTHTSDHWAAAGISVRFGGPPPPGGFNAYETSTAASAITGVIKTKIAGSTASVDMIALDAAKTAIATGFTGIVRVEVLNTSDNSGALDANGCRPTWTVIQTLSPDPEFVAGDNGRKTISFTQANSFPNARLRITFPAGAPTVTGCSNDNFAVRPNAFASFAVTDTDWQTAGTTRALTEVTFGTVTHKAGRPLSVRATALNAAGTPAVTTNYVGAPTATLTACVGAACTATFGALTLSTTFAAGQLVSDVASYNDVGSFGLQLVDSTFSSVDAADGSTTTERNITPALINVGRFVPDHFAVALNAPVFGTACGSFSYIGQAFNYTTAPVITVTAQDFTNNTTTLYATIGSWFRITSASLTGKAYTAATGTLDVTGLPGTDPVILSAGSGMGTLTFGSGTGLFFGRTTPTAPASPYDADISLAINVIDADGVILATNPARFGTATAGNGIAFSSGKPMRFGRLTIRNANGSQLVPLPVLMEAQHWNGTAFITNTADGCTAIAAAR